MTDMQQSPLQQVEYWLRTPQENENLEFKEAKNSIDFSRLLEYCVAIGNEGGGSLVLGMTDKLPRSIVGTKAIPNTVKTSEQVRERTGFRVDIKEIMHPDGRIVEVCIPSRPRGSAFHLDGRYLMRSGSQLVPMSEDRLRSIFDEGKPNWLEQSIEVPMSAQEVIDSLDTQSFFELLKEPFPTHASAIISRLTSDRLILQRGSSYSMTRLCGILLARRLADFPDLKRKAARVVVYQGNSKLKTKLDQIGEMGYAVGFARLVHFVVSQLPQNEIITDAIRQDFKMVPSVIVRELIANALVHQDFSIDGSSVMIEVYDNRLEFSSPGRPLVETNHFIDSDRSRNERLAELMRRLGICEKKGSGIDKVVYHSELLQLPAPRFDEGVDRTNVLVFGPKPFEGMDRDDRIRATYQHAALKRVMDEYMTNQSLRDRFKLPAAKSATVSQIIAATLEAGLIKADKSVGDSQRLRRYLPYWA
ncbi:MAG: putative DNA binding domain-containing protein [Phycisphaerales bacterium]|nr:putative DNA binding domain-containing protein [Phycisphaerales bacterium]